MEVFNDDRKACVITYNACRISADELLDTTLEWTWRGIHSGHHNVMIRLYTTDIPTLADIVLLRVNGV